MIKTYKYLTSKIFKIFNFFFKSVLFESYISDYEEFLVLKIPYMSKKAISYIDNLILEKKYENCFEWGSGGSTLWLEEKLSEIISIEESKQWYSLIKERIDRDKTELVYINPYQKTENAELISSNKKGYQSGNYYRYVKSIENYNEFDLIIIDGRAREKCLEISLDYLSTNGAIIFDDTYRRRYIKSLKNLNKNKYNLKNIYGLSTFQFKISKTTIITRK